MPSEPKIVQELLVKSKQRVSAHGEVFTPSQTVEQMLDLVKDESTRIDSRFLEPACGEGNFLKQVLARKLASVEARYKNNEFERRHFALLALMSIYGIELLEDNAELCRGNLAGIFNEYVNDDSDPKWAIAARKILTANIVQADAITMKTPNGYPLVFPEWGYLGKGKFQRRDFKYDNLTQRSAFAGTLFEEMETDQIFVPQSRYLPMTVLEIAESTDTQ